jgi:hypothetical protein
VRSIAATGGAIGGTLGLLAASMTMSTLVTLVVVVERYGRETGGNIVDTVVPAVASRRVPE